MKSRVEKLVIIDGCGSELLDVVMGTVNYELSGDGAVLVHTDNLFLKGLLHTNYPSKKILDHLNGPDSGTTSRPYEGLILLRR